MLKSGLHKLAVVVAVMAIGFMAACSSSSSTNDALTQPADNHMGVVRFDIDPQANTVDITPVGSPWVMTSPKVPGDGAGNIPNVTITSSNVAFSGGNTMDFDATIQWGDAGAELFNVRIGVNASTNTDVTLTVDDNPACGGPWSGCLPVNDPAITYVADDMADGPETKTLCDNGLPPDCVDNTSVSIAQGCGSQTAHWTLFESGGAGYSFWADLYGEIEPVVAITADSRYDENTASIYLRPFTMDGADSTYPAEVAQTNGVASGEWFYIHYYVDNPGNNKAGSWPMTDRVNGPKHIEDTENMARYGGSAADYWYTGAIMPFTIRWDPAIIMINANDGSGGSGAVKFSAASGTKIRVISDINPTAFGYKASGDGYTASNAMGAFKCITSNFLATTGVYPPTGQGADGFAAIDFDVAYIAIMARTGLSAGDGTFLKISYDDSNYVVAYSTNGVAYSNALHTSEVILKSMDWPNWCEQTPGGTCFPEGAYNAERSYICIQ